MIIVADTTPLISLMKCNCLGILQDLFGKVQIPEAVYAELTSNPKFVEEAITITSCEFIHKVKIDDRKTVALFKRGTGLDIGESIKSAVALMRNANRHISEKLFEQLLDKVSQEE